MIVKMNKAQIVVREEDRERLLDRLGDLGVVHITPINPSEAVADEKTASLLDSTRRAVQILSRIEPAGSKPEIGVQEAIEEVLTLEHRQIEMDNRLSTLHRQLEQQGLWGDLKLADLEELKSMGVEPLFYLVPSAGIGQFQGELVSVAGYADDGKAVVAVIDRSGQGQVPEEAELLPLPSKDNPSIRKEAADIEAERLSTSERLARLAHLLPELKQWQAQLEEKTRFSIALNSGLKDEELFAIQGWVPADQCETLSSDLEAEGIAAGIRLLDPEEEELPPTLIKYPPMTGPIKSLFDMLGTTPGYREFDISVFFMITMPVFAAMLNGDAGYGIVLLLPAIFIRQKVENKLGKEGMRLLIIFGVATVIWGLLNGNIFGVKPDALASIAPLERGTEEASRNVLIAISFLIGCAHLVTAHLRRILAIFPDMRFLAETGWIIVLLGILGLIWAMFPFFDLPVESSAIIIVVAAGMTLVVLFSAPYSNPLKRIGVGFASSLLPLISSFGDTMSYIRLVAVGLASYYIAVAFNDLGSMIAGPATWAAAAPVLLFGHALNLILIIIAIFAHGVRLNMLEFSSHCSVEWSGYEFTPFAKTKV
ncbi:MAG: V-type ATPase 116kDa subunit family protein [Dehalococcoidia bacterium]